MGEIDHLFPCQRPGTELQQYSPLLKQIIYLMTKFHSTILPLNQPLFFFWNTSRSSPISLIRRRPSPVSSKTEEGKGGPCGKPGTTSPGEANDRVARTDNSQWGWSGRWGLRFGKTLLLHCFQILQHMYTKTPSNLLMSAFPNPWMLRVDENSV